MRLQRHLDKTLVFPGLRCQSKEELLRQLADQTAEHLPVVDANLLWSLLRQREAGSTTGIGSGVAVPHCTVDGLDESICVLAQVPDGVDFGAIDEAPVHFVFLLLSPPEAIGTHLRLLARIARLLHSTGFPESLRESGDADAIYQRVVTEDSRHID
ncbi:MAG: PTS sugar transporter subunit IIA [Deltaproteobacteria bacterium]|jgi:PTS system nitrogen regulatory IIA component|nr:PTS sugar transporter subunit IIA [Deltaproteobacteria bacterium]MBW2532968.1 PTS sugar transporter subunit IIA [Deltaproteobacteria bacterium]